MNRNRKIMRGLTAGLAVGMSVVTCAVPVFAAEGQPAGEVEKDETVYVNADATGKQQQVTVSDWLKNAGTADSVTDQSSLKDIKNIKGEETFQENGDVLTWNTEGKDIYYQGTTDEELPVSVKFTYYLDGKETAPEDLKGKSGHVTIHMDYTNNAKKTVNVDGKEEEMYSPFVMVTTMVLPNETFSNVVIDNGKVISDGSRNIVVGFAVPGLKESLGIEEGYEEAEQLTLPESLEISADVTDFSLSSTFTAAIPDVLEDMNIDGASDFDSFQDALDKMENAALQLVSGSGELADGAEELAEGVSGYTDGVDTLNEAVQTCLGEDGELNGKVKEYVNGVDTLVLGVQEYADGADALAAGITSYIEGEQQLAQGAEQFSELKTGMMQVQAAVHKLSVATDGEGGPEEDLKAAAAALAQGTRQLEEALGSEAVQGLMQQVSFMVQTGEELINGADTMETTLQESVAIPVQDMVSSLTSISSELQKLNDMGQKLQNTCTEINNVVYRDNEKIQDARTAGANSAAEIQNSIDSLSTQKNKLQHTQPEAAQELEEAIQTLEEAKGSAEELTTLQNLEEAQSPDLSYIDMDALDSGLAAVQKDLKSLEAASEEMNGQLLQMEKKLEIIRQAQGSFPSSDKLEMLTGQIKELNEGMQSLNQAISGKSGLSDSLAMLDSSVSSSFPEAVTGLDAMSAGFTQLGSYNEKLLDGAAELQAAGPAFRNGASALAEGTGQLTQGLNLLGGQLSQGAEALAFNSGTLRNGAAALRDGAFTLRDGMTQFEREGTGKMKQTVEDELGDVLQRLEALASGECSYDTFSGKDSSMAGNVKFLIETEEI